MVLKSRKLVLMTPKLCSPTATYFRLTNRLNSKSDSVSNRRIRRLLENDANAK